MNPKNKISTKAIAGCDIKSLAGEFGTPLYVYDRQQIVDNYRHLHNTFTRHYKNTKIHFSVKANSNINILKIFNVEGAGADCSSPIELLLSEKAGFDYGRMLYTGNYESDHDLGSVPDGVRINLDDINSFKRLIKLRKPEIASFRINPGIGRGGHEGIVTAGADAKFGVPYEKAAQAYRAAKKAGIKRFGIHMMTGSNNLEPYYFAEIMDKLLTIAGQVFNDLGIRPEYIDMGGGFGVPYTDEEPELNIDLAARLISEIFIEKCRKYGFGEPELLLEPGRYLIANAGYLVTKVTGIKESYKKFAGLDAGMNTLIRPALYGAVHRHFVYGKSSNDSTINLCGQICENSDIFSQHVPSPDIKEGDLVVFRDAGAYGYVMSSNYNNRLRPAEALVSNGKSTLIRRRERFEDILNLYE